MADEDNVIPLANETHFLKHANILLESDGQLVGTHVYLTWIEDDTKGERRKEVIPVTEATWHMNTKTGLPELHMTVALAMIDAKVPIEFVNLVKPMPHLIITDSPAPWYERLWLKFLGPWL